MSIVSIWKAFFVGLTASADDLGEIFSIYLQKLSGRMPAKIGIFLAVIAVFLAMGRLYNRLENKPWRRSIEKWIPIALVAASMVIGLWMAFERASMMDDAYISFRYARNLVEGNGLVFNPGERVEGYTNFLWTMLIALFLAVTNWDAPAIALVLSLACFLANLAVVYLVGRRLNAVCRPKIYIPLACLLLGSQVLFTSFATSGLETAAASLLVNLGVYFLIARFDAAGAGLSGSMFILAVLTRPDHAIFYACAALVVLVRNVAPIIDALKTSVRTVWRRGLDHLLAFAAPFGVYAVYLAWKYSYYGSLVPNTYYAKAADLPYFSQGFIYAALFYLGTHFWIPTLLAAIWMFYRIDCPAVRSFKLFVAGSFVLFNFYVLKIGGDFMFGRFYITLAPLVLLAAENLVYALDRKVDAAQWKAPTVATMVAAGFLMASVQGVNIVEPKTIRWSIADESTVYPIASYRPIVVGHKSYRDGVLFGKIFADRGIYPKIARSGIGMVGYYSRLPLVDLHGLTNKEIAHGPAQRSRPGHRKWPSAKFLNEADIDFIRVKDCITPKKFRELTMLTFAGTKIQEWEIFRYNRNLLERIEREVPEVTFMDFPQYLDSYIEALPSKTAKEVRADLKWFRFYYFDRNIDLERLAKIESYLNAE